uniref:Uncharacterized protein n=1 Tax=Panthera tigris altaica TaxID=74533 RepID=A0A8C9J9S5_PANTA
MLARATPDRDISLHNFSTRLWEQLVHFHVMWLTHWLFLWVGAMPHLCNLTVALCSHYDSIPPGRPTNRCLSAITFKTQIVTSHYL